MFYVEEIFLGTHMVQINFSALKEYALIVIMSKSKKDKMDFNL